MFQINEIHQGNSLIVIPKIFKNKFVFLTGDNGSG